MVPKCETLSVGALDVLMGSFGAKRSSTKPEALLSSLVLSCRLVCGLFRRFLIALSLSRGVSDCLKTKKCCSSALERLAR